MNVPHRIGPALLAFCALALAACSGGLRLRPQPSAAVDLSGTWRVVRTASDDWDQALRRARHGHRPERRHVGMDDPAGEPSADVAPLEPLPDNGPREILARSAQGAQWLTIGQEPTQISIHYGSHDETYPTDESDPTVVSMPNGIAERFTGWKGKEFVIALKSKTGPRLEERYAIDPANGQLVVATNFRSGELSLKLRRVFERAAPGANRDPL